MDNLDAVDTQTFQSLMREVGRDYMPEILEVYCTDVKEQLQCAQKALLDGDGVEFTRRVHTIKSTSLSFGALAYGALARELEGLGREGKLDQARLKFPPLLQACDSLRGRLKELCNA